MAEPVPQQAGNAPAPLVSEHGGIAIVEYPRGARIDRAMAEHAFALRTALLEASGKPRHRLLMTGAGVTNFDREASRFSTSRRVSSTITAAAILCSTTLERHLGSVFMHMWRPSYPVKLFDNRDDALRWLAGFPDD